MLFVLKNNQKCVCFFNIGSQFLLIGNSNNSKYCKMGTFFLEQTS